MSCAMETSLGAYVLGGLEPEEQAVVDQHLAVCPGCRELAEEIGWLPGRLAMVSLDDVDPHPEPAGRPDELAYRRLLAAASAETGRMHGSGGRRRTWMAAAAAVAVLAAGTGTVVAFWPEQHSWRTVSAAAGRIHATAKISATTMGSSISLRLRGVNSGEHCRLVATASDGHREVASSWEATYAGAATVDGATSIVPADLRGLTVETFDGRVLLALPVPTSG